MPILTVVALMVVAVSTALAQPSTPHSLRSELATQHVQTALLFPSQAVDESPVWSPDSRYLAANIQGKWFKLEIPTVLLEEAKWHGKRIGIVKNEKLTQATDAEVAAWMKGVKEQQSVVSESGITVALSQRELSTSLVLSRGKNRKTLWRTELENCGGLQLSPDGRYVAFVCETNGVFAMDIEAAFANE